MCRAWRSRRSPVASVVGPRTGGDAGGSCSLLDRPGSGIRSLSEVATLRLSSISGRSRNATEAPVIASGSRRSERTRLADADGDEPPRGDAREHVPARLARPDEEDHEVAASEREPRLHAESDLSPPVPARLHF